MPTPYIATYVNKKLNPFWQLDLIKSVSVLTLFLAAIFGFDYWLSKVAVSIALFLFLLFPSLITVHWYWLAVALSSTVTLGIDWYIADNNKYILVYWLWVIWIVHFQDEREAAARTLHLNARFFLVFIFLAAALQKSLSPTYIAGTVFELKLLFDERFKAIAYFLGVDSVSFADMQMRLAILKSPFSQIENDALILNVSRDMQFASMLITWYDLLIQILIGFLFLVRRIFADSVGHILLIFFILTAYMQAPVFGFAWVLAILGYTLTMRNQQRALTIGYIATFMALIAYQAPWRDWVADV